MGLGKKQESTGCLWGLINSSTILEYTIHTYMLVYIYIQNRKSYGKNRTRLTILNDFRQMTQTFSFFKKLLYFKSNFDVFETSVSL